MLLSFETEQTSVYRSGSQIARVLSESWVIRNMYCPRCGSLNLQHYNNNKPVADFFCPICHNDYELKSKNGTFGHKVADGAYETMIARITGNQNPDFLFMSYSKKEAKVKNFIFIPKHFFVPDIIEKRKPLAETARRAGWVGCNILIDKIPDQGRIYIVSDGMVLDKEKVLRNVQRSSLLEAKSIDSRGWLFDVLNYVNHFSTAPFSLRDMYVFEQALKLKHPQNNNIKAKIRQQLQILRDKGFLEFLGNGLYRKKTVID